MSKRSVAAAKKPATVAERRRAIRSANGDPISEARKVEIDLTKPNARKALTALYPRPKNEEVLAADAELEAAALAYIEARDEESLARDRKEVAGNVLCNAIGGNLGVAGAGWKAEWDMSKGNVDWTALAKDLKIDDETIAKYRKPETRGLTVREVADEG